MNTLNNTNIILQEEIKNYPVKDFLERNSKLVRLNNKALIRGNGLTKTEAAQENRLYELRDKAFQKVKDAIANYYDKVIDGDYRYDGMPEMKNGIRGWAERKIWRLLIEIGEPGNLRFKDEDDDFWKEA